MCTPVAPLNPMEWCQFCPHWRLDSSHILPWFWLYLHTGHEHPTARAGVEESFQSPSLWIILSQSLDTLGSKPSAPGWQGRANKSVRRVLEQILESHCNGSYQCYHISLGNVNLKKSSILSILSIDGKRDGTWEQQRNAVRNSQLRNSFPAILPWWAAHLCLSEARWELKTCRTWTSALGFSGLNNTLIVLSVWEKKLSKACHLIVTEMMRKASEIWNQLVFLELFVFSNEENCWCDLHKNTLNHCFECVMDSYITSLRKS